MSELKASEALFGFVGWLTTREEVTQMGGRHNCARIADLVQEFCVANGLQSCGQNDMFITSFTLE